jgi:hypothetical protein
MIKMPEQPKEWSKKRGENLMEDLDIVLGDLCVIWGFCNGLTGWELTRDDAVITAASFANAVLTAEGLNAQEAAAWFPKIQSIFVERYGDSISEKTFGVA